SYTVNGESGVKPIQKEDFGVSDTSATAQYGDMWWNASESGWGVAIAQQYRTLFSVIYTYGQFGQPLWYVMPGGSWNGNTYSGTLYATTDAPGDFYAGAFDTTSVKSVAVGPVSITFSSPSAATLRYTVNGIAIEETITRQPF